MPKKAPQAPTRGGTREGAGRPIIGVDKSVVATFRCSPSVRAKFYALGGADWVTPKVIKAAEPK